jgi:hypothetical protein
MQGGFFTARGDNRVYAGDSVELKDWHGGWCGEGNFILNEDK